MRSKLKKVLLVAVPLLLAAASLWGWVHVDRVQDDAELLATTGQSVLRFLGGCKAGFASLDVPKILRCYADDYTGDGEGVWLERLRSDRDGIQVYDWALDRPRTFRKADVEERLRRLLQPIGAVEEAKLKLDEIERIDSPGAVVARTFLWLRGTRREGGSFESKALLRTWLRKDGREWVIHRQELLRGQTVTGDRQGFTDVTETAGIDFVAQPNPHFATDAWRPVKYGIVEYYPAGVATADYDGDGWYDVFFGDGAAGRLYRNAGDGTFVDATAAAGLPTALPGTQAALFADFDNDGDQDLFLGRFTGENRLYRNDGAGTFTDVTAGAGLQGLFTNTAAAADYDGDGRLDLYLGRHLDPRTQLPTTYAYTRNAAGNLLLRNQGDLRFADVTARAGVRDGGITLGVAWGDYDGDGHIDVYASNDFGRNALFRNRGDGTFADVAPASDALDFGYGMGTTAGDVDNDGDLDLFVSNIHSGQRWYPQSLTLYTYLLNGLRQGTLAEDFPLYREIYQLIGDDWQELGNKMGRGNSLLLNDGRGNFRDAAGDADANPFGWFWGSALFDYDNDGLLDIYQADGWITANNPDDL